MSKILLIDLREALLQFAPAIWGKSGLNENQAKQLAKKLVALLEQRCRIDVIEFEVDTPRTFLMFLKELMKVYSSLGLDKALQVFVVRKEEK